MCGQAAESVGLLDITTALIDRAKAEGKLRADTEPWDVPGLICGIGRAVRTAPGAPALTWQRHLEIILAGLRALGRARAWLVRLAAMPETVTPAGGRRSARAADTLGIPLGTGQPPAFLAALGERDDWADLRIYGALLLAWSEAFTHPHVHYLSGFFGPVERALRDQGANISFAPADFRRFEPLLEQQAPRVMATVAAPPDETGWCSLSLHAGGTLKELRARGRRSRAAARRRGLGALPADARAAARLPARAPPRRDRRARRVRRRSRSPSPSPSRARSTRAIAEHARRVHPRRRDPADRHRHDPVGDRRPARRGRRRRLRRALGDVHQRPHAAARGGQGHQPQGPVRRRLGRDLRRRLAPSSTPGSRTTRRSRSCRSRSSTRRT